MNILNRSKRQKSGEMFARNVAKIISLIHISKYLIQIDKKKE